MAAMYTTGAWTPFPGQEDAFVEAWKEFSEWAASLPGAGRPVLARDRKEPGRFVSFAPWESEEAVRAWKSSPEFKPRMGRVQQHVDRFIATELEVVAGG